MDLGITDELYKDILINIKEFSMVRFFREEHVEVIDPESKTDKDTIHSWPNNYAINRFHRNHKTEFIYELERNNVEVLDNKFMFVYLLNNSDYKQYKTDDLVDYLRFKHLRNYFTIERLKLWARNNAWIEITLQYRDTFPNKYSNDLRISNTELIDYLLQHEKRDELVWKISMLDDPSKYFKLDYTMTDLVFKNLQLYFGSEFTLEKKEECNKSANNRGYILEADREKYEYIVEKSYANFKHLVFDPVLYLKVKEHYENYVTESYVEQTQTN